MFAKKHTDRDVVHNTSYVGHREVETHQDKNGHISHWQCSSDELARLYSAIGKWRKEGRADPVMLTYNSMEHAEYIRSYLESEYDIHDIATLGAVILIGEDADKLEHLLEHETVHRFFESKLRVAINDWCRKGGDNDIELDFASSREAHYAHQELYDQFGVYDEVNECDHILRIPSQYVDVIVEKMHLNAVKH